MNATEIFLAELSETEMEVMLAAEQYWQALAKRMVAQRKAESVRALVDECRSGKKLRK